MEDNMKRKIIGIFLCTLMIASVALPVIGISDVEEQTALVLSVVDQQQTNTAEMHWLEDGVANWQQFVNHGNMIEKVDCHIGCYYENSPDITLSIEQVIGSPLTSVTYQATALPLNHQGWFTFDFPDVNLTYGETYHIVIRFNSGSEYAWSGAFGNPYPLGLSSRSAQWDYAFKTIVDQIVSPAVPILDLLNIKGGIRSISVVLKNFGEGTAENIYWEMTAIGGLFFYPELIDGTIGILYPGQEETIQIAPVRGLGKATINFYCRYNIVDLPYDVDFEVKQEWRDLVIFFLDIFSDRIQPTKDWMMVEEYSYFSNRTDDEIGVELNYEGICNMHNVRVTYESQVFNQGIEFLAACKFTDGKAFLYECWLTKELVMSGDGHWEVELVDGG
jgi:hypothetical protein